MIYIGDIVFNQEQLDAAVKNGHKNICLCDNSFLLPPVGGMSYMGIGRVNAVIRLDRCRRCNITFEGFEPTVIYTGGYTGITENAAAEDNLPLPVSSYGSYGSYGSHRSVYGSGSGTSSRYTSGSAASSFLTSYISSYGSGGSAQYLLSAVYIPEKTENADIQCPVFYAAGYGLDLI